MSLIICPYCFQGWSRSTAAFRCVGPADDPNCPRAQDEQLAAITGQPELRKKVLVKTARFGRAYDPPKGGVRCDCGARTAAICPNCHHQLPHAYAEGGDRMIGMVGTKSSGKSHFIAILFHELFERIGARYKARVEMLDDDTRERVRGDLLPRIYKAGVVLEASASAATDERIRRPLGVRLSFGKSDDVINTVFFDTAGEDLVNSEVLGREARYVGHCGALILLLDPLQIPAVRDALGSSVPLPDEVVDPSVIVRNATELLRREQGIAAPKKLTLPLAVTFSKVDAIRPLFDEGSPVFAEPQVSDRYDAKAACSLSALLRAHVVQWLGPEFDHYLSENYRTSCYFAVSALGAQPVDSGRLARDVVPHRIADPLLWILSEWKAIPTAK